MNHGGQGPRGRRARASGAASGPRAAGQNKQAAERGGSESGGRRRRSAAPLALLWVGRARSNSAHQRAKAGWPWLRAGRPSNQARAALLERGGSARSGRTSSARRHSLPLAHCGRRVRAARTRSKGRSGARGCAQNGRRNTKTENALAFRLLSPLQAPPMVACKRRPGRRGSVGRAMTTRPARKAPLLKHSANPRPFGRWNTRPLAHRPHDGKPSLGNRGARLPAGLFLPSTGRRLAVVALCLVGPQRRRPLARGQPGERPRRRPS